MRKLSDYFGYSEDMDCIYRAWYIGSWKDAIKDEIVAGRPVLYWALEDNPLIGAHTFVCDGYDADNDLFQFTAQIVPCANCGDYRAAPPTIVGNMEGDAAEPIPETSAGPSAKTDRSMTPPDQVYPNPTDGEVTVHADGEVQGIVIYNMQGLPVGGWKLLTMTSDRVALDISPLSAGTYLVRVATPQAVVSRKVVKN